MKICKLLSKNRSSVFCVGLKFEALSPMLNPDDTKGRRLNQETKRNETPEYKTVRHKEQDALRSSSHGPIFQSWEVVLPTSVCSRASCRNMGATWMLKRGRFAQYVTLVNVSYHQHQRFAFLSHVSTSCDKTFSIFSEFWFWLEGFFTSVVNKKTVVNNLLQKFQQQEPNQDSGPERGVKTQDGKQNLICWNLTAECFNVFVFVFQQHVPI